MNKVYWIFRIILYYIAYENIEMLSNPIEFIGTMIIIYYLPNMSLKMINLSRGKAE